MRPRRFFPMARCLLLSGAAYFVMVAPLHAQATAGYAVKPGDTLEISVWKEPDLQRKVLVRPDGAFSFPLVGEVDARGKTVPELNKLVSERLTQIHLRCRGHDLGAGDQGQQDLRARAGQQARRVHRQSERQHHAGVEHGRRHDAVRRHQRHHRAARTGQAAERHGVPLPKSCAAGAWTPTSS